MRHYLIYILCCSLFLGSCSREDMEGMSVTEEMIPPSELVEVGEINGIVRGNDDELLGEALVQLYNEEELIKETTTNSEGEFVFVDVLLEDTYKVFVQKDSYNASISLILEDHFNDLAVEVSLLENIVTSPFGQPESPLDSNFVLFYGEIKDANEDLVSTEIAFVTSFGQYFLQNRVIDGRYAVLLPIGEPINVFIFDLAACPLFPEPISIEPLFTDTNRDFISDVNVETQFLTGQVRDCIDEPLESGTIQFYSGNNDALDLVEIINGEYTLTVEGCVDEVLLYEVYDEFGENISIGVLVIFDDQIQDIIVPCNIEFPDQGYIFLDINNMDSLALPAFGFYQDFNGSIDVITFFEEDVLVHINFWDTGTSTAFVEKLCITIDDRIYYPTESLELTYSITTPDPSFPFAQKLEGEFSGVFNNLFEDIFISGIIDVPLWEN